MTRLEMSDDEKRLLKTLAGILEEFTERRQNIPVFHVAMLLKMAADEGKSQKYYADRWGKPPATVSRVMLDFGKKMRHGQPGMGLVDEIVSAHSLREHQAYLSDKGRSLLRKALRKLVS